MDRKSFVSFARRFVRAFPSNLTDPDSNYPTSDHQRRVPREPRR